MALGEITVSDRWSWNIAGHSDSEQEAGTGPVRLGNQRRLFGASGCSWLEENRIGPGIRERPVEDPEQWARGSGY